MSPEEFWLIWEARKPEPVYRGKRFTLTGSEADGILKDLKTQGIEPKWRKRK